MLNKSLWMGLLLTFSACSTPKKIHTMSQTDTPLFTIPFETNPNQTVTYQEAIACYEKMAAAYPSIFQLRTMGTTDSGYPLHTAILNTGGEFEPEKIQKSGRRILLINNGIHPGEPEGIDATLLLLRDYLTKPELRPFLEHIAIVVIPVYNIDGCINRNSYTRANQDGPESYGFRGNARNYDLNRDFVKCDSRNARGFNEIFQYWNPDIFVDNHTSNGADYQYTMTLIATLHSKLETPLADFLNQTMLPNLYGEMKARKWEMIPYVDTPSPTPDSGIINFCDYGRYSTGYAAMWNTIGFMPETHTLKPFADRLWSNYHFMDVVVRFMHTHHDEIAQRRKAAFELTRSKKVFHLDYAMDPTRRDTLLFKGYEAKYKASKVSGLPRLWYDRSAPYEKEIAYYNYFNPSLSVEKPLAYIIPQAWENVLLRLDINGVKMTRLKEDVAIPVESYRILKYEDRKAWEGHYFHYKVQVEKVQHTLSFHAGDYLIELDQDANRYLMETLEPQAPDSWFAWNFFDPILMQKEYFSDYVFEDLAAEYLDKNPAVRAELEAAKAASPELAESGSAQLDWVYRHSPWYEPSHKIYPVARVVSEAAVQLAKK